MGNLAGSKSSPVYDHVLAFRRDIKLVSAGAVFVTAYKAVFEFGAIPF
jgi:hypothetical protein